MEEINNIISGIIAISRKLYEGQGTPESARDYSIICNRMGEIYKAQGKLAEALEKYGESLAIRRKLYEEQGTPESEQDYKLIQKYMLICIFNNAAQKKYTKMSTSIPQLYSLNLLKEKQIHNILEYCARGLVKEEIIVFCSTKIFNHNGKRGYVFTAKGIYADDSINKNVKGMKIDLPILYSDIEKCEYEEQHSNHVKCILKDGRYLHLYTDIYSQFFCEVINQIADVFSV